VAKTTVLYATYIPRISILYICYDLILNRNAGPDQWIGTVDVKIIFAMSKLYLRLQVEKTNMCSRVPKQGTIRVRKSNQHSLEKE
jgi:hypothetical protein